MEVKTGSTARIHALSRENAALRLLGKRYYRQQGKIIGAKEEVYLAPVFVSGHQGGEQIAGPIAMV